MDNNISEEEKEGERVEQACLSEEGPSSKTKKAGKKKTNNARRRRDSHSMCCAINTYALSLLHLSALTSNKKKSKLT